MAKANLILPNGTKVDIEGNADEVALLLSKFSQPQGTQQARQAPKRKARRTSTVDGIRKAKLGPIGHISAMAEEDFFKSKRTLADIQKKLEEKGHIYAQTSLSPALVRLVRKKALRRIKTNKQWVYVS